ncbi:MULTISPECIES: isochorismatase family protein [Borreliella]|uniref:nicotinamidase n=1 Tax=Borreliella finlandensis TaxID=498741 RepID=A0A806C563_9SPIR|nr:isochorismatase family protein [Borreliella finlandensis]ACN93331.1 nicotinamidase [Borreliella finlandensis]AJY72998.1 isochorismatase family protein [Borreliella afzelii K78]
MPKEDFIFKITENSALILIDIQNDFLESGALPVPNSNEIIPLINQLQNYFKNIVATKDWHCKNHVSFLSNKNGGIWPNHCVQNTWGSEFPSSLNTRKIEKVFLKGKNQYYDSYSGFYDDCIKTKETGLNLYLKNNSINILFIAGLALDFCVKETILDAINLGFQVYLIIDATRSITPTPELIIRELKKLNVLTCFSKDILNSQNKLNLKKITK